MRMVEWGNVEAAKPSLRHLTVKLFQRYGRLFDEGAINRE
jgi:hypothetical protein